MPPLMNDALKFAQDMNLILIIPELLLTAVILICVGKLAFSNSEKDRRDTWLVALVGVFATLLFMGEEWYLQYAHGGMFYTLDVLGGLFTGDLLSLIVRTLLVVGTLLVLLFTKTYIDKKTEVSGEFYVLLLSALLGGMMLSGAKDLIMVFVALETLSISSYVLVAYLRGSALSAEAGLKYLLYGGMATAVLLFGFSILYGLTGSVDFNGIANQLPVVMGSVHPIVLSIMTIMIVGGICFKLTAAPFHMWAPDVYEGAPTPVVAFLSVVSKIAAFAFAIRLFTTVFANLPDWAGLVAVLSVISMVVGNVVALAQKNIKRLLAYSTVAHVGYLLLGLVVLSESGLSSLLYYLIAYLFMNLGAFAVVTHFENETGHSDIAAYAGLVRKRPGLVFVLSMMFLSLAGIPITSGFFGKFFLFQAVTNAGNQYLWLVIVALLTSTISLYYYLNVIRLMVIAEPSKAVESFAGKDSDKRSAALVNYAAVICLVATLALGVFAEPMMAFSALAVKGVLSGNALHSEGKPVKVLTLSQRHP